MIYILNSNGINRCDAMIRAGHTESGKASDAEMTANAKRLVRCWNTHDQLVEALKDLFELHGKEQWMREWYPAGTFAAADAWSEFSQYKESVNKAAADALAAAHT